MKKRIEPDLKSLKKNRGKVESCCSCLLLIAVYFTAYFGAQKIKDNIEPTFQTATASNDEMPVIILDAGTANQLKLSLYE